MQRQRYPRVFVVHGQRCPPAFRKPAADIQKILPAFWCFFNPTGNKGVPVIVNPGQVWPYGNARQISAPLEHLLPQRCIAVALVIPSGRQFRQIHGIVFPACQFPAGNLKNVRRPCFLHRSRQRLSVTAEPPERDLRPGLRFKERSRLVQRVCLRCIPGQKRIKLKLCSQILPKIRFRFKRNFHRPHSRLCRRFRLRCHSPTAAGQHPGCQDQKRDYFFHCFPPNRVFIYCTRL